MFVLGSVVLVFYSVCKNYANSYYLNIQICVGKCTVRGRITMF